jgi:tetratricopeptide (TPR) repeat protein
MALLARVYSEQRKFAQAESLMINVLEARRREPGEDHPDTLRAMDDLAELYQKQGDFAKAEPLYLQALEVKRRRLGEDHPDTFKGVNDLAVLYMSQGELTKAEPLLLKTLEIARRIHREGDPIILTAAYNLAEFYWRKMKVERSVPLVEEALRWDRERLGPDHPETLKTIARLGFHYRDAGRVREGTDLLEQARAKALKHPDFPVDDLDWMSNELGVTYERAGQFARAETLCRETLETIRQRHKEASSRSTELKVLLARNLLKQQKCTEAEPLLRECLKYGEKHATNDWRTFSTKSLLGGSLLGQKKYSEAEPLLLAGYEGMKQREGKIEPVFRFRLTEAIERLVQFYEVTGKKDKAEEWRRKLRMAESAKPAQTKHN